MSSTPPNKDGSPDDSAGRKPVTRKMVRERAAALAEVHGRPAQDASKSDWERAKWELSGEPDSAPTEKVIESAPESESSDPASSVMGKKAQAAFGADENAAGLGDYEEMATEVRYRCLFEEARDGILILDPVTRKILDANPFMADLLGCRRKELLGKELWQIGLLKDESANEAAFRELQKNHFVRYESLPLRNNAGHSLEAEFVSHAYEEEGRKVIQCNIRDITKRHGGEEALRLSESLYRRLFETAQDGILVLDAGTGQVVDANPYMQVLLGYSLEQFLGKKLWEIGPFKGVEASKTVFAELKVKDSVRYESLSLERKDGRRVETEFISVAYFAEQRRLIQCNVRDITERRRAEEALRLSESLYRRLFETAQDGILVLDADTGQVVDANPFMRVLLGYSLEEFLGKKLWEIGPFKGIEASKTVFTELKVEDSVRYESLSLERKDGLKVEAEFISNAYFAEQRRLIQCNIRDITERRRLERLAEQRIAELARSNDELAQFGYVASHDLQEPLRAVASCVQLLQRRYGGQIDARADEFIAHAVAGIKRMETLIDDLLAYSRVGSQAQPLAPTNCEEVLADAVANLAVAISESGALVTHDLLPVVEADHTQLAQVFQNLIGNAIKFRGARSPVIHVSAESRAGEWVFSVTDNGIGIESQYFERIFQVFQRLHTRKEYQGTGIGLAISKKIVERHGGRIWIESQLGQGSGFCFSIPARNP
jgi:PAS domain S-box-containing protein